MKFKETDNVKSHTFIKALKIFFLFFFSGLGFFSKNGTELALFGRKGIVHFPP